MTDEPPSDAAGSPWPYRPAHLCTDNLPDDDDGPPPWGPRPKVVDGDVG